MEGQNITYCMCCGVPNHLHGTCCGWINANVIVTPQNNEERQWRAIQQEAFMQMYGCREIVNASAASVSFGIVNDLHTVYATINNQTYALTAAPNYAPVTAPTKLEAVSTN